MSDKSGSPPCGIYIRIDDYKNMQSLIASLRQMALVINRASGYEKNMHVVEFVYDAAYKQEITDLVMLVRHEGMIAIISAFLPEEEGDILGADGVLLTSMQDYKAVREALGKDAIIGLICDENKVTAQKALDHNFDYVSLSPDVGLVNWWVMQTDIPCLVSGNLTNDTCGAFARAGASFVETGAYIFGHEKGVMQGAVNILYALDLAQQVPDKLN